MPDRRLSRILPTLLLLRWGQNVNTDKVLYCLIVAVLFCIGNLLSSRQRKSFFDVVKERRMESNDKGLVFSYFVIVRVRVWKELLLVADVSTTWADDYKNKIRTTDTPGFKPLTMKGLVCYSSIKTYRWFSGFGAPAWKCFDLFGIEYKILVFSRP